MTRFDDIKRSDYKTRKEYKWARKNAAKQEWAEGKGFGSLRGWAAFIVWFLLALAAEPLHIGALGTLIALVPAYAAWRVFTAIEKDTAKETARKRRESSAPKS